METKKVWFVTGASKGLGLTLIKKLLLNNYRVVATSRSIEGLIQEIGNANDQFLPLAVDLVTSVLYLQEQSLLFLREIASRMKSEIY